MSTLYIAGPMTGLPEFNYPAFFEAEQRLWKYGFLTLNPARQSKDDDADSRGWVDYMRLGITDVLAADGIAVLPGWETSRGARLEVHVAVELRLPVRAVEGWITASVIT